MDRNMMTLAPLSSRASDDVLIACLFVFSVAITYSCVISGKMFYVLS